MTYQELIDRMDPAVYQSLRQAVELGKWPDGRVLTAEQREICMEAVLYYESQHVPEDQRVGYINRTKSDGSSCGPDGDDTAPIRILN